MAKVSGLRYPFGAPSRPGEGRHRGVPVVRRAPGEWVAVLPGSTRETRPVFRTAAAAREYIDGAVK